MGTWMGHGEEKLYGRQRERAVEDTLSKWFVCVPYHDVCRQGVLGWSEQVIAKKSNTNFPHPILI